jgi:hypothetical protein
MIGVGLALAAAGLVVRRAAGPRVARSHPVV